MGGDITIYINPCHNEEHKKYNGLILRTMEESKLEYNKLEYDIQTPSNRLQGLIKVEVELKGIEPKKYESIAKNLRVKLENRGINVKRTIDFRGKPIG